MSGLAAFFESGLAFKLILAGLAVEIALAGFYFWRRRQGLVMLFFVANGLAGAALVLAMQSALRGAGWLFVASYLLAGLLAHLVDVVLRVILAKDASGIAQQDRANPS
ncbi:MAG: hypothetical protein ACKOED_03870 [Aestuariivirga sp.]|uniref:hypothetical protein n=1 Tax=Aestuariivirga sp. TaxID=2650926 RepID=UPI0038CF6BE6